MKKRKTDKKEERSKTTNKIRDAKKIKRHVQGSKLINDGKTFISMTIEELKACTVFYNIELNIPKEPGKERRKI